MDNKIKLGIIINAVFAALIVAADCVYMLVDCSPYITKTIASVLFVLCGAFNLYFVLGVLARKANWLFCVMLFAGLVFACAGDILLIDHFVLGALFFGLGHILFFMSFCFLTGFKIRDLLIGTGIFVAVFLLIELYKCFNFGGMKTLAVVYALIISLMLGKAISNVFEPNHRAVNIVIAAGALLFFISDFMLLFHVFGSGALVFDIICLVTYYPAEFILALSIFVASCLITTPRRTQFSKRKTEK